MSTPTKDKTEIISHGEEVAKDLGWPEQWDGVLGVAGGLVDLGAEWKRPRSYRNRMLYVQQRSRERVRNRVAEKVKQLS